MTRALRRGIIAAAVVALTMAAVAPAAHAGEVEDANARRLLVLSLPGVSYADLDLDQLPHIKGLLDDSAIANLSVRGVLRKPTLGDGYVTIGAGARARGRVDEGQCLNAHEVFEGGSAGDALARRAGIPPESIESTAVVCLAAPAIADRNDDGLFGAEAGLLGDELERAGFNRAVIGNADRATPVDPSGLHRAAGSRLPITTASSRAGRLPPSWSRSTRPRPTAYTRPARSLSSSSRRTGTTRASSSSKRATSSGSTATARSSPTTQSSH